MTAYLIVEVEVTDPTEYGEYIKLVPSSIAAYGGRYLVRGGRTELLEGEPPPARLVVLEFPSVERAKAWLESPEYQPARDIRHRAARTRMIAIEGVSSN